MNPLLIPLRPERDDEDWTAQCSSLHCDAYRKASEMQQCRCCEHFWCPPHWENDYSSEECVSCWSRRMRDMEWALKQDEVEAIRAELIRGRAAL